MLSPRRVWPHRLSRKKILALRWRPRPCPGSDEGKAPPPRGGRADPKKASLDTRWAARGGKPRSPRPRQASPCGARSRRIRGCPPTPPGAGPSVPPCRCERSKARFPLPLPFGSTFRRCPPSLPGPARTHSWKTWPPWLPHPLPPRSRTPGDSPTGWRCRRKPPSTFHCQKKSSR